MSDLNGSTIEEIHIPFSTDNGKDNPEALPEGVYHVKALSTQLLEQTENQNLQTLIDTLAMLSIGDCSIIPLASKSIDWTKLPDNVKGILFPNGEIISRPNTEEA